MTQMEAKSFDTSQASKTALAHFKQLAAIHTDMLSGEELRMWEMRVSELIPSGWYRDRLGHLVRFLYVGSRPGRERMCDFAVHYEVSVTQRWWLPVLMFLETHEFEQPDSGAREPHDPDR